MRLASIDCGTNSIILLLVDVFAGTTNEFRKIEEQIEYTRLGQGIEKDGVLREDAMERSLLALAKFRQRALDLGAKHIFPFATEAVRAAQNGKDFLKRASDVGVNLRLLSTAEEAKFAWIAVNQSLPHTEGWRSVLDVGGGSTQLTVGRNHHQFEFGSVPLGIVRLSERYLHHNPPTSQELQDLTDDVDEKLRHLPTPRGELIGVSGSLTILGSLQLGLSEYNSAQIHGFILTQKQILSWQERLTKLSVAELKTLKGMDPKRADLIYPGVAIAARIMLHADLPTLTLCGHGGRWGILAEWVKEHPMFI